MSPPERMASPRPKRDRGDEEPQERKRLRQGIDEAAEQFVCPITLELPVDPVTAEDGFIYERAAIEQHFDAHLENSAGGGEEAAVRSPRTNEPMGPRLLAALHVRSAVEALVCSGGLRSELARAWRQRSRDREEAEVVRRRAEQGDAEAMWRMGTWRDAGEKSLGLNRRDAYRWFRRSAEAGDVRGMACLGAALANGRGVAKCHSEAVFWLSAAAHGGSDRAAFGVGKMFKLGVLGMQADSAKAKLWLQRVVHGELEHQHCTPSLLEEAAEMLRELEERDL